LEIALWPGGSAFFTVERAAPGGAARTTPSISSISVGSNSLNQPIYLLRLYIDQISGWLQNKICELM
jgi:hypothetical protein